MLALTGSERWIWLSRAVIHNLIACAGRLNGNSNLITFLKETPVPLRVYGKWQEPNYTLQVDQLLRTFTG